MYVRQLSAWKALASLADRKSQILRLTQRIKFLEDRCKSTTPRYGPKTGGASCNELWDVLSDERTRLTEQLQRIMAMERQVQEWILLLPKPLWRLILQYRYLEGMSYLELSDAIQRDTGRSYSVAQLHRLHRQALEAAEVLWPLERKP